MSSIKVTLNILLFISFCVSFTSYKQNKLQATDLVFNNGVIYTVDCQSTKAEAVAIKNGKIIYVGDDKNVISFIGNNTKVIDLKKRMILPGFIDSHCHPISSYRYFYELNLYGLKSKNEIQNAKIG